VPHPASIFEGVRKLPPGHFLMWNMEKGAEVNRYWMPPHPEGQAIKEMELVDMLRTKLNAAVASHLETEVPLGAFLSGGLDSSTVVALMNRHASKRVRTFSIGFADEKYDESAVARAVAAELGTDHTELILSPKNVECVFETIAAIFDEPFSDSSAIPTFLLAQLARQSVTVVLSGDGGDELFGGYTRYQKILQHRSGKWGGLSYLLAALGLKLPHIVPGRNRLIDLGRSKWGRFTATVIKPVRLDEGGVGRADQPGGSVYVADQLRDWIALQLGDDFAAAMMNVDLETYLPGDILTKVDRTSMAVSLETRIPLLDFDLVDFALQIPGNWKVNDIETKRLFRRAVKGIVPESVLSRPKQGFAIPLGRWLQGPLRYRIDALRDPSAELRQYVDTCSVRRLVFEHVSGRRDNSVLLWRLIVLDGWLAALNQGLLRHPPALPKLPVR
jgi:asparagine synthase (glutamine-hydrolysing)